MKASSHFLLVELQTSLAFCAKGLYVKDGQCLHCPTGSGSRDGLTCVPLTCVQPCFTCVDSEQTCITMAATANDCAETYYRSGNQCIKCDSTCAACTGPGNCLKCAAKHHFLDRDSQECSAKCPLHCLNCEFNLKCDTCFSGYWLETVKTDVALCTPCAESCATCVTTSTLCQNCAYGYHPQLQSKPMPQTCAKTCTDTHCLTCIMASDRCTACEHGYTLLEESNVQKCVASERQLVSCDISCHGCSLDSPTLCTECAKGYHPQVFFDPMPQICEMSCLDMHCLHCIATNVCTECIPGWYLESQSCDRCDTSCYSCTNTKYTCLICSPGYYPVAHGNPLNMPQPCSQICASVGCLSCPSSNHCVICDIGYILTVDTGTRLQACTSNRRLESGCPAGQYISGNFCLGCPGSCQTCTSLGGCLTCQDCFHFATTDRLECSRWCPPNCQNCDYDFHCSACKNGFFLTGDGAGNQLCDICPTGCAICTSISFCTACTTGYILSSNQCVSCPGSLQEVNGICGCPAGLYTSGNYCLSCPGSCRTCTSLGGCLTCQDCFHFATTDRLECSRWCPPNCLSCDYDFNCSVCANGYFLTRDDASNQLCKVCPPKCTICTSSSICTACITGYTLSSSQCVQCQGSLQVINGVCGCPAGLYLSGVSCLNCPAGQYQDLPSTTCKACDPSCATCSGAGNVKCTSCVPDQVLTAGACLCRDTTMFNNKGVCTKCQNNFKVSGNECVLCASYFQPSELTLTVDLGYTGFTVSFARQIDLSYTTLNDCIDIFVVESIALMGSSPLCVALENQKIVVTFGTDYIPASTTFYIDYRKIIGVGNPCSFEAKPLPVTLTFTNLRSPTAVLRAPNAYSFDCDSGGLELSGVNSRVVVPGSLSYRWTLLLNGAAFASQYDSFANDRGIVFLPNSALALGTLRVTLTVQDRFNSTSTATGTVVIQETALSVVFDCGNSLIINTTTEQRITGSVQTCSRSQYSFGWSLSASSRSDQLSRINAVLSSQRGATLSIARYSLPPGSHVFTLTAVDATGNIGTATLPVTVLSSSLVVVCDKAGAPLAPSKALTVDCSASFDPDDPAVKPSGVWTCAMNSTTCADRTGAGLQYESAGLSLSIAGGVLAPFAVYSFTLVLTKAGRSTASPLTFSIASFEGFDIEIQPARMHSNQRPAKMYAQITATAAVSVRAFDPKGVMPKSTSDLGPLTVINPPTVGGSFYIELTVTFGAASAVVTYSTSINMPPSPGKLTVTPAQGVALETVFAFVASEVQDRDGPDLPYYNNFGYYDADGTEKLFALPSTANSASYQLSSQVQYLFNKVCDSRDSCDYAKASVSVAKANRRDLQAADIKTLFDELSANQYGVFPACTMIATELTISASDWTYIARRVDEVLSQFISLTDNQLMTAITCFQALISMPPHQYTDNFKAIVASLTSIANKYADNSYDKPFARQMQALQQYPLRSLQEVQLLDEYLDLVQSRYVATNYPGQASNFNSPYTNTSVSRLLAPGISSAQVLNPAFSAMFPGLSLKSLNLTDTAIANLRINVFKCSGFPAGLVSAKLERSGAFGNFTWTDLDSPEPVDISNLPEAVNLTIPVFNASALAKGAQCIALEKNQWYNLNCFIFQVTNSTVSFATRKVTFLTVVPTSISFFVADPMQFVPLAVAECDRYYAPAIIMAALVFAALLVALIGFVAFKLLRRPKEDRQEQAQTALEQDRLKGASLAIEGPAPQQAHRANSAGLPEDVLHVPPNEADQAQLSQSPKKDQPAVFDFLKGHYLLGLVLVRQAWNLLLLLTMLLSELFFLGVFYYFVSDSHSAGTETSMQYFFSSYAGADVAFYIYSIAITSVISLVLTTLLAPVWKTPRRELVCRAAGLVLCVLLILLFIILIVLLNLAVCYEYAGRWTVGFLWAFLTEVLVLEFAVAAYRWALVKYLDA